MLRNHGGSQNPLNRWTGSVFYGLWIGIVDTGGRDKVVPNSSKFLVP